MGGMYLTDDLNDPTQWEIPDTTLDPGEFLLFWADEDLGDGPLHMNFKLSRTGEEIGLFSTIALGNVPVDTLTFGLQTADISSGRYPDAGEEWRFFNEPTPGASNEGAGSVEDGNTSRITVLGLGPCFPNPFSSTTEIRCSLPDESTVRIRVYDVTGRLVRTLIEEHLGPGVWSVLWDGRDHRNVEVAPGVYFCRLDAGRSSSTIRIVLLR